MKHHPPPCAVPIARRLRRDITNAERAVWRLLREAFPQARFRRQVPIRHYIVDFASHRARLIVEVDGGQHCDAVDGARTKILEEEGYRGLRIWNSDALGNREGVWTIIDAALRQRHPHPTLPHQGGGLKSSDTA